MTELADTDALLRRLLALSLALVQGEDDNATVLVAEMTRDTQSARDHLQIAAVTIAHLGGGLIGDDALIEPGLTAALESLLDDGPAPPPADGSPMTDSPR